MASTATATKTSDDLVVRVHPDVVEDLTGEADVIDIRERHELPNDVDIRRDDEAGYAIVVRGETICHALNETMARRIGTQLVTGPSVELAHDEPESVATGEDRRRADRELLRPALVSALDDIWQRTRR